MIHIDDLVRGQLSDREEEERAGAWLRMRDLLDKEMPAGRPVPFPWKRVGGYIAVLSLFAVLATGGYLLTQSPEPASEGVAFSKGSNNHSSTNSIADNNSDIKDINQLETIPNSEESTMPAFEGNSHNVLSSKNTAASSIVEAAENKEDLNQTTTLLVESASLPTPQKVSQSNTVAKTTNSTMASTYGAPITNNSEHGIANRQKNGLEAAATDKADGTDTNPAKAADVPNASAMSRIPVRTGNLSVDRSISPTPAVQLNNPQINHDIASSGSTERTNTRTQVALSNKYTAEELKDSEGLEQASKVDPGATAKVRKDTVQQISLVYRNVVDPITGLRTQVRDTTSVEQIVVAVAVEDNQKGAQEQIVPAAQAENKKSEELTQQANQAKRITKKNSHSFRDAYLETKHSLSQAPFYLGVTAGINGMSGSGPLIPGFHFGLNGELELSERWSLLTELRYINRFNNGKTIDDPYRGAPSPVTQYYHNGTAYTVYESDSFNHYFNFSTFSSGNLPIMVKYSVNRFFMLAGVDLIYNFRMSAEEIDAPVTGTTIRDTLLNGQNSVYTGNGVQSVQLSDLGARFGIGYILGVGYKATPNLHLDFRMSHSFWDNASGGGAIKVSEQLYRNPSFQLSLGYRLGGTRRNP